MRRCILFTVIAILSGLAQAQTSTPIYVTIVMHVEQAGRYDIHPLLFEQSRTNLYRFASMLAQRGVKFNFQSDWSFLAAVTNFDKLGHTETGGTNIIAWMKYALGFEIDPHNHIAESVYNYADVAALISQCGVQPSGVAGGFLAQPVTNSQWGLLQHPITGAVYSSYVWTTELLWGGGTSSHQNESNLWFSGIYRPKDPTNFWMHQEGNLPCIGHYTGKDYNWTNLDMLIAMRDAGILCTNRIYTCNIMTGMGDLSSGFITEFDNQLQIYTGKPGLIWAGIAEITNVWVTEYAAAPSYLPFSMTNDLDDDGLTDGWEVTNFCGMADTDGSADADEDNQTDGQEFISGTSPTNVADYFRFLDADGQVVTWRSAPGRTYVLEGANDLDSWGTVYIRTGQGPTMSYTNSSPSTSRFFRVGVSL